MKNKSTTSADFAVGDHIRTMGLGGVKHHAIVVDAPTDNDFVEIIEYGAFLRGRKKSIFGSTFGGQEQQGLVRRMRMDITQLNVEVINTKRRKQRLVLHISGQAKGFYKAGQRATSAVAHPNIMSIAVLRNIVASVGEATDSHRAHVENDWAQTQQLLDDAFSEYKRGLKARA